MVKSRQHANTNNVHNYLVVGRSHPSESNPNPKIFKMRIFADDAVRAKSKFWYFLKKLNKVKKSHGEILSINEVSSLIYYLIRFSKKILLRLKFLVLYALINLNLAIILFTKNSEVLL